jgi:hypothetical protein
MQLQIIQNNYLYIPGFITLDTASSLANEFKDYCKKFKPKDLTDPSLHVCSILNWLPFVRLLVEKTSEVSLLLGESVLPTYTYSRWQTTGHALPRHRDRPSCEISLSLNLCQDKPWGIWIQKPNKEEVEIILNPSDAVMYLGCQADHWRDPFEGNENVQLFLHYVRSYGPKAWAYFDKQQQQDPTPPIDSIPKTFL